MSNVAILVLFWVGVGLVVGSLVHALFGRTMPKGIAFLVGTIVLFVSVILFGTVYQTNLQYTDANGDTHRYEKVTQVVTDRGNLMFTDKDGVVHNVKFSTYKTTN